MKKYLLIAIVSSASAFAEGLEPLKTKEVPLKILTSEKELTLYVFDKDGDNVSNCYDACAKEWPPMLTTQTELKEPLSIVKRKDNTKQIAFKKHPLYFYDDDTVPGDIFGDGVGKIWHVVHP